MRKNYFERVVVLLVLVGLTFSTVPAAAFRSIDAAGMDRTIDPGDDFFSYANGGWMRSAEIPADRSSFGTFDVVFDVVNKRTAELITAAGKSSTPDAKMVGDYYAAFLDEKAIEARGLEPLKAELAAINTISSKVQLSSTLGSQLRADVDPLNATNFYTDRLFGVWISADFNNPKRNVPYLLQGGLGLPDRENYLGTDERNTALQAKYKTHIAAILKLANIADAEAKAARIYDLEHKIAETHADRLES
ncbi:MAG TPA: M13 family metallopeptidase N-terminal domain-containing protein, partial [Pyrinomonadaceae bacterium]|nr:M13 family metallopeptidase N-terminal domain-containing protein [Pyrinomonadaceae bacterium]